MTEESRQTIYEWIGGADTVRRVVEAFYPKVQENAVLSPLFPGDIRPVMEKQYLFLTQFLGGPMLYSEQYGHPMMRARHLPFEIDREKADNWLQCMKEALAEAGLDAYKSEVVLERLSGPASHFINKH